MKNKNAVEEVLCEWQDPEEIARGNKVTTKRFRAPNGGFFMKTKLGPLIGIQPGALVDLWSPDTIETLFYSKKIIPILPPVPPEAVYRVIIPFQTVIDGEYKVIHRGQELRLNQEEALEMLRLRQVLPLDENIFHL